MLSKEEISKLKINVFNQCDDETIRLVAEMLKHTEQLELDKQKLIEKLEKVKQKDEEWNALNGELAVWTFAQEILSILKGE